MSRRGRGACRVCQYSKKRPVVIPVGPSIAYVPLTKGQWALIDSDDAIEIGRFNWFAHWARGTASFYAIRKRGSGHISMQTALLPLPAGLMPDHKNGNTLDNRRSGNLRAATRTQNNQNRRIPRHNKSGVKGVSWCNTRNRWHAQIKVDRRLIHLGYFEKIEDAAYAYRAAALHHHREFARADTLLPPICPTTLPLEALLSEEDIPDDHKGELHE